MKRLTTALVSTVLALPYLAIALSVDSRYCDALSSMYESYIETAGDKGGSATPVEVVIAIKCKSDPASSIPVLEKQLKAARLSLPPRG